jgi:hypothetical protein
MVNNSGRICTEYSDEWVFWYNTELATLEEAQRIFRGGPRGYTEPMRAWGWIRRSKSVTPSPISTLPSPIPTPVTLKWLTWYAVGRMGIFSTASPSFSEGRWHATEIRQFEHGLVVYEPNEIDRQLVEGFECDPGTASFETPYLRYIRSWRAPWHQD